MDKVIKANELIERLKRGGDVTDSELSETDMFSVVFSGDEFGEEAKLLVGRLEEIKPQRA